MFADLSITLIVSVVHALRLGHSVAGDDVEVCDARSGSGHGEGRIETPRLAQDWLLRAAGQIERVNAVGAIVLAGGTEQRGTAVALPLGDHESVPDQHRSRWLAIKRHRVEA